MRVLILANGDPPSDGLLERLRAEADLFIAADGAANRLAARGFAPDLVLGDFDSLSSAAREMLESSTFLLAADQDASDLDKAIRYARQRGATEIAITGAAGGRMDHTLVAVALLLKHLDGPPIRLVDDLGETRATSTECALQGRMGDTVSLIAFGGAQHVTTEGLLWPLRNAALGPDSRGVSNVMTGSTARICLEGGAVVVCHLRSEGGAD